MKRQNGISATPAGSEMKVRTTGIMRPKKTVAEPWRANQLSVHSMWCGLISTHLPCFSSSSMRPK